MNAGWASHALSTADLHAALLLAGVTLLDGVRRVPPDAYVLRRVLAGDWRVIHTPAARPRWLLVSVWSPFVLTVVLERGGSRDHGPLRASRWTTVLRAAGALSLLALVLGVPAAAGAAGGGGLLAALAALGGFLVTAAALAALALRRLGAPWRRALRLALPLLSPFRGPRGAEVVLEQQVAGAPPLAVAHWLLGAARFAGWARPAAFDALHAGGGPASADAALAADLRAWAAGEDLRAIVSVPPPACAPGEGYCARCGSVYRAGWRTCASCAGLALRIAQPA